MDENTRIDYIGIIKHFWGLRKKYFVAWAVTFVLACVWILPQPRYYKCDVMLAPEGTEDIAGGSLSSLASSFGFNLGVGGNDAIYPMLYPDLFSSPDFLVGLLGIRINIVNGDGEQLDTDYYTYLTKHEKKNWLLAPVRYLVSQTKKLFASDDPEAKYSEDVSMLNPFCLSRAEYELMSSLGQKIRCTVDKKTDVTTIEVTDQDRIVCALLADSVKSRLQTFITDYRTSKARLDCAYYRQLAENAKTEYEAVLEEFNRYCDSHQRITMQSVQTKRDELEKTVLLKYETYTAMLTQFEAAKAKVQERTPAFTTLKSASAPVKPAGPKRMIFVLAMLVLVTIGYTGYELRRLLL